MITLHCSPQGVAKSFSIAYHNVDIRRKLLRITESAISWIQRRCPHISEISVFLVEPSTKTGVYMCVCVSMLEWSLYIW